MKVYAVTALIFRRNYIIGVSRKDNPFDYGLPGGKVDGDESPEDAIIRETYEETGLVLDKSQLIEIYSGYCGDKFVKTFLAQDPGGTLQSNESGVIVHLSWEEVCSGSFGAYNRELMKAYQTKCRCLTQ
jgi:8-oxo-dGTP diphosphatase